MDTENKDVMLPADSQDTVQCLSWSPVANHLAVASWDGKVRIYDISSTGQARGLSMLSVGSPVFSCDWAKDGNKIVAAGADNKIHVLDLATNQHSIVGSHAAPVRGVHYVQVPGTYAPVVASGSWDGTVKFWDLRQPANTDAAAAVTLKCDERVCAMDAKAELLVAATAGLKVHLVDLKNPSVFLKTIPSPLQYQTKTVSVFPDGKGWAIASIEGRCGIRALNEADSSNVDFTFRCHREVVESKPIAQPKGKFNRVKHTDQITKVWTVNDIQFHPVYTKTFTTAGSDGSFFFWDRGGRTKLRGYPATSSSSSATTTTASPSSLFGGAFSGAFGGAAAKTADGGSSSDKPPPSITATSFSRDGALFAYAVGYDWSWGHCANTPQTETKVMLHSVEDEDAKPKESRWG